MAGQGISYPPPTENVPIFDSLLFTANDAPLTISEGSKYFLTYPNAQGTENLLTTNVAGLLTANSGLTINSSNLIINGTPSTNYIQFPDGTKQYSASSLIPLSPDPTGTYTLPTITLNSFGQTTAASSGTTGVVPGTYTLPTITVNSFGQTTAASSGTTAVVPGSYTNTNLTVNSYGQITAASNGTSSPQPTLFTYQYSGTYTPSIPAGTVSISVLLIGNGGQRGQTGYGVNTTGLGGTGGAGGYCYIPRLTTTKNITINFTAVGAAQLLISGLGVANNVYAEATAGGNGGNSPLYNSGNGVAGTAGAGYQYLVGPTTLYTGQTGITAQTISFPPGTPDYYQTPAVNPLVAVSSFSQYGQGGCSNIIGNYGNDVVVYPSGAFCALWCYPW